MNMPSPPPFSREVTGFLAQKHQPFIGGRFVEASRGGETPVVDPATGQMIASVPDCDADVIDCAVRKTREALWGPWARMRPVDREKLILDLADGREHGRAVLDSYLESKTIIARYA
jgi:phenylacetaldehyde dehydrogenase